MDLTAIVGISIICGTLIVLALINKKNKWGIYVRTRVK